MFNIWNNLKVKNNFFIIKEFKKINLKKNFKIFNYVVSLESEFLNIYRRLINITQENYLLTKADFDNFKKKSSEELNKSHRYSIEDFSENLLPVIDSLELTLGNRFANNKDVLEGLRLTLEIFIKTINKKNIKFILPNSGDLFDPNKHLAISTVSLPDKNPNIIINVLQKGYYIYNRVLRPALVVVNKV